MPAPARSDDTIPKKLRDDAILEAICQIQFSTSDLPEMVIGRLSLATKWKGFTPNRLPLADVPVPVRNVDPNLRAQPVFELRSGDGSRVVRLSESLMSYHIVGTGKYIGWTAFKPEIEEAAGAIFERLQAPKINRLTLRYINAIVPARHHLASVHDLRLEVMAGGSKIQGSLNLNYVEPIGRDHLVTTRVADPQFVSGTLPDRTVAVVDVEVTTPAKFTAENLSHVVDWIEGAHTYVKQAFFKLIPRDVLSRLQED